MPSPFPGMDPYIELTGDWVGFHNAFIVYCSDLLNQVLPEQYVATLEARIRFQPLSGSSIEQRSRRPDVAISHRRNPTHAPAGPGHATTIEPVTLAQEDLWTDEVREAFIEIVRVPGEQLVTVVELLSPSNKTNGGEDRSAYLLKRRQLLHDDVNLVEIDLLLDGARLPMLQPLPAGDYFAFVSRAIEPSRCDVYAWSIRQPLPTLPIPLMVGDEPAFLDLAAIFQTNYDRGRYGRLLRYDRPLHLPLQPHDRAWAADLVATGRM